MTRTTWIIIAILFCFTIVGCQNQIPTETTSPVQQSLDDCQTHTDTDANGFCDRCSESVEIVFTVFGVNDLHGKIADADTHPGVDELSTYIKEAREENENVVLLSMGDMWQGSAESNLTQGQLTTDWMNHLEFDAMILGNHEYDWGEEAIEENAELAEFPFLGINVYDRNTNKQVEYCQSSVVIDQNGIQIGVIGAMGDCYSSISSEKAEDVYFIVGDELTNLVMEESVMLRQQGVDFIIYAIHDGYGGSTSASVTPITGNKLSSYYDIELSAGYVDLVFEGHTHQRYLLRDEYGVYHLQNKGDNKGITRAEIIFNIANDTSVVNQVELLPTGEYAMLEDDPIVEELLDKYSEDVAIAFDVYGYNSVRREGWELRQLVADLYYEVGMQAWGDKYEIALGGGFISVRSPYNLEAGEVTYSMLHSLFPFDNQLTLCSVRGIELNSKFFETNNDNYFICYGDYGRRLIDNVDPDAIYYVVVDTYSAYYAPNRLTVVEEYDPKIFARDLLAEYIAAGGME